jgi:hypothetical protein
MMGTAHFTTIRAFHQVKNSDVIVRPASIATRLGNFPFW